MRAAGLGSIPRTSLPEALAYAACIASEEPTLFPSVLDNYLSWVFQADVTVPCPHGQLRELRDQLMAALDAETWTLEKRVQRRAIVLRLLDEWWSNLEMTQNQLERLRVWTETTVNAPRVRDRALRLLAKHA
jgi:hypothetical protein